MAERSACSSRMMVVVACRMGEVFVYIAAQIIAMGAVENAERFGDAIRVRECCRAGTCITQFVRADAFLPLLAAFD